MFSLHLVDVLCHAGHGLQGQLDGGESRFGLVVIIEDGLNKGGRRKRNGAMKRCSDKIFHTHNRTKNQSYDEVSAIILFHQTFFKTAFLPVCFFIFFLKDAVTA